jgi:xylulose-5-phosphate/fructose-6-phosphate phosphoketolase
MTLTSPLSAEALSQIAHMNRAIREREVQATFITGPGHGGPALVASTWLEGTYSEVHP